MILNSFSINTQLTLKNRIAMAPMTRCMSHSDGTPTPEMATYYAKRADAGLIITEGTIISKDATGYRNVPGLYLTKHIDAWRRITDTVHEKGGMIFNQLWHVGRVSHPRFLNNKRPISSSATLMTGPVRREKNIFYGHSREATPKEIQHIIADFARAADFAKQAGFDGVELHGANGYLIDQFLHYHTNQRIDAYGGTPENMTRFLLQILSAIKDIMPLEKVGIRLSPAAYLNQLKADKRDKSIFIHLFNELNQLNIAYVHTGAFDDHILYSVLDGQSMTSFIRQHCQHPLISCGSYNLSEAETGLKEKKFDMVAFGRPFLANPFLIRAIKEKKTWRPYDVSMLEKLD